MRTLRVAAAAAGLFGSVLLLPSTTEAQIPTPGIPGSLNPVTGTFTARANFPKAGSGVAVTGSITITTTVLIDAALQKTPDQVITCTVSISTADAVAGNSAGTSNNVIRAGAQGTCTSTISFIWEVASTTKTMFVTINVSTFGGTGQVGHSAGTSTTIPITAKTLTFTLAL